MQAARCWQGWLLVMLFCAVARSQPGGSVKEAIDTASSTGWDAKLFTDFLSDQHPRNQSESGYRSFRVVLEPKPKSLKSPASMTLIFTAESASGPIQVTEFVDVPADAASVEHVLSVPHYGRWNSFRLEIAEEGVLIDKLTLRGNENFRYETFANVAVALHLEGRDLFPGQNAGMLFTDRGALALSGVYARAEHLPTHWIDYTQLDLITLNIADVVLLVENYPQQWNALRQWVGTGGNLWITGVDASWRQFPALESALHVAFDHGELPEDRGWQVPVGMLNQEVQQIMNRQRPVDNQVQSEISGTLDQVRIMLEQGKSHAEVFETLSLPKETYLRYCRMLHRDPQTAGLLAPFYWRPLGFGHVVAISDPATLRSDTDWIEHQLLLSTVDVDRLLWAQRHGMQSDGRAPDFFSFLIPGVGLPPVGAFQILISLFVLVIGPLNYWLLYRSGRLQLLLITVPLCAFGVIAALGLYALWADGLGVRVRARSCTLLDQRQGEAVTWARLSMYAGMAPRNGLKMPADLVIYPLRRMTPDQPERRVMHWEDGQLLADGWLASRTPTQFLTIRNRPSDRGLDLLPAPGGGNPAIKNRLDARVVQLIVRDHDGKYYESANLSPGGQRALITLTEAEALAAYRELYHGNVPEEPVEMQTARGYQTFITRGSPIGEESVQSGGLLEYELRYPAAPESPPPEPGTYLAIVEQNPEVVHGVEATEEASFHVILGRW